MRIATWNVNSLKARLDKVGWWIERAKPDVILLQETKLGDADAPHGAFEKLGYQLAHHGEGRWNGVAIASRVGLEDVTSGLGDPEARMISASCGGVRVASIYAPNGREVATTHFDAKLAWFDRLRAWLGGRDPNEPLVVGGDYNVAPTEIDIWDPRVCHGGTHVSPQERRAFADLLAWGLVDAYRAKHPEPERFSWWDYRAGAFQKNYGMRIDHMLMTASLGPRLVWAEIDREARKGKPIPSDHAPVVIDLDEPGIPFDAGWESADARIAERRAAAARRG